MRAQGTKKAAYHHPHRCVTPLRRGLAEASRQRIIAPLISHPMPIAPGSRLGPYEVVGAIGAGGMGEVYRARDTKLERDVALKLLSDTFATHPDRRARFEREAQVLASLNHPHIAHIYSLEESDTGRALVMELVDGVTLADRMARGP